jgi:hypothetical protein
MTTEYAWALKTAQLCKINLADGADEQFWNTVVKALDAADAKE